MKKTNHLGPYRIVRELGRGGMGTVYEAVGTETNQPAAIKLLSAALAREEGFRDRFEAEIETLLKLKHPNIVRLFGFGEQEGNLFYAMELVDGSSLEEELRGGRRFTWREVTQIGIQTSRALRHAHDRGVIHRDIKPGNLLVTEDGQVKLSDFGIARLFGSTGMTSLGSVLGTAEYMAPEQAGGSPVGPRADLYSLGAVFYVLLTGRPVFQAKSLPEVLHKHRFEKPDPVGRHAADVPAMLEAIIAQLLEKDPAGRVPNATILGRQLEAMERALSLRREPANDSTGEIATQSPDSGGPKPSAAADRHGLSEEGPATGIGGGPASESPGSQAAPVPARSGPAPSDEELPETKATRAFEQYAGADRPTEEPKPSGRFTSVDEDELDLVETPDAGRPWISPHTVMLAVGLLAVGLIVWYFLQPPSADALYQRITAQTAGESVESLREAEDEIRQFLTLYPRDPRSEQLREYQNEIDLHRLEFRFELRAKGLADTEGLMPVERAYLEALNHLRLDPDQGALKLQALVDLYGDRAEESGRVGQCLELARRRLERLGEQLRRQSAQQLALVQDRLDRADQLRHSDPDRARAMYQAVIQLYGEKSWAGPAIRRARQALSERAAPDR